MSERVTAAMFEALVTRARKVRLRAYAPYSGYLVGAAILTRRGKVYAGCNVENATYGATICAERNAVLQMVAAGDREPIACAIVTAGSKPGTPCGICRQTLIEFAPDLPIELVAVSEARSVRRRVRLADLLPDAFDPSEIPALAPSRG